MSTYFIILLQISLSLLFFWGAYVLFIRRIHQFGMQRLYLNASLLLSVLMPLMVAGLEINGPNSLDWQQWFSQTLSAQTVPLAGESSQGLGNTSTFSLWWIFPAIYFGGVVFRMVILIREAVTIRRLYISSHRQKETGFTLLFGEHILRPFSFFHFIFLGEEMNADKRKYTISHESAHVTGHHSWDNLLFELAKILLWFHPCIYLYKQYLNEVHEYLADQEVIRQSESKKPYAHFLLENACEPDGRHLMLGLSNKLITKRIIMLSKPSLPPINYLYTLLLIPLGVLSFTACSVLEEEPAAKETVIEGLGSPEDSYMAYKGRTIRSIQWKGNTVYSDETLSESFGLKPGDTFDNEVLAEKLSYNQSGQDVTSMYMDNGYLFFTITTVLGPVAEDQVDVIFTLYEGDTMEIGTVCVTSDVGLQTSLMDYVDIRPGQLFSRSDLMSNTQNLMAAIEGMDVTVIPTPVPEEGVVNLEFALTKQEEN